VGKYSEFENLRKAGIRHADLKGYTYSREDVTARSLANAYSQLLGTAFSQEMKPLEVEIVLAEVGYNGRSDEIYRVSYDGSIFDEPLFAAVGGKAEPLAALLKERLPEIPSLSRGVKLLKEAFAEISGATMPLSQIEAGLLERASTGRVFRRLGGDELAALSGGQP